MTRRPYEPPKMESFDLSNKAGRFMDELARLTEAAGVATISFDAFTRAWERMAKEHPPIDPSS